MLKTSLMMAFLLSSPQIYVMYFFCGMGKLNGISLRVSSIWIFFFFLFSVTSCNVEEKRKSAIKKTDSLVLRLTECEAAINSLNIDSVNSAFEMIKKVNLSISRDGEILNTEKKLRDLLQRSSTIQNKFKGYISGYYSALRECQLCISQISNLKKDMASEAISLHEFDRWFSDEEKAALYVQKKIRTFDSINIDLQHFQNIYPHLVEWEDKLIIQQ